jgi:hypothetical protein
MEMDLLVWVPGMFFLGIVCMGACFLFVKGCDKI